MFTSLCTTKTTKESTCKNKVPDITSEEEQPEKGG
jgi:hypothetical protein